MKKGLLHSIFNNFGYKLFSLFLALVVWSMIQGEQILEKNGEIDVAIEVPEGYMIRGETERSIAVTMKGPRVLMLEAPTKLSTKIKVPPRRGQKFRIRIDKDDIKDWDNRLSIIIHDPYLTVFIDKKATRTVPVKDILQGTPAEGYFTKKVIVKPRTIRITGLRSDLFKVREVATEPIDITGIQQNKMFEINLVPPTGFRLANFSTERVNVSIQVDEKLENKRYGSIPIEVVGATYLTRIKPKYASIVIQATPSILKFVKRDDLKAFVEVRELGPGRYEKDIKVKIPPDTVLIEAFPEKASVIIKKKKL